MAKKKKTSRPPKKKGGKKIGKKIVHKKHKASSSQSSTQKHARSSTGGPAQSTSKRYSKDIVRIPTRVPGFDALVQGGFKQQSINLIAGGPGSGKTIFAIQFLLEGIRENEPAIYLTFEEKKEKLYEDMLTFGWDLEDLERKGLFVFLEYTPEQVKKVLVEGGGTIDAIIEKTKASRLVIDSITSFALLYQDELTKKEAALALFNMISDWGCTALLTSQSQSNEDEDIVAALEFEADSIIFIYHVRVKGARTRGLEILKMRGTKIPEATFKVDITSHGLSIDPNKRIIF